MTDLNPYEEEQSPLTYTPTGIVDRYGQEVYVEETEPNEAIPEQQDEYQGVAFGLPVQTFPVTSVYNADFALGPPNPSVPIGDENPLPYWKWVADSNVTAYWVDDTSTPSHKAVKVVLGANSTSGTSWYLEQVVPILPLDPVRHGRMTLSSSQPAIAGTFHHSLLVQCLDVDGATTGSESDSFDLINFTGQDPPSRHSALIAVPSDARFGRIRAGGTTTGDLSPSYQQWISEVSFAPPRVAYVTLTGSDTTLPATGNQAVPLDGNSAAAANRWIAPGLCWVVSVSARTSGNVSISGSNDLEVKVYDEGQAAALTPTCVIPDGNQDGFIRQAYASDAVSGALNALRFRTAVPTGTLSSTSLDIYIVAVLALLVEDDYSDFT